MEEKNKLYVGNLSFDIDEDALSNIFAGIEGVKVADVKVISDKFSGRSKGFGFVTLENDEMAQIAISQLNGKEIGGREVYVNIAKPMEKRDNNSGAPRRSNSFNR